MSAKRKFFLLGAMMALLSVTLLGFYAYHEFYRTNPSLHKLKPQFTLSPDQLIDEYAKNESGSNTKYLDKIIDVTGTIKTSEQDEKGFYTISLGNTESMSSVRCTIDSLDTPLAATLKTNESVHVRGVCTGYNADDMGLGADVILNRCVIIK